MRKLIVIIICVVLLASCSLPKPEPVYQPSPSKAGIDKEAAIQAMGNIQKVDTGMSAAELMDIYGDSAETVDIGKISPRANLFGPREEYPVGAILYKNVLTCYYTYVPLASYKTLGWSTDTPAIKTESYDAVTYGMALSQVESIFGGVGLKYFGYIDGDAKYKEKYTGYYWETGKQQYCIILADGKVVSKYIMAFDGRLNLVKTCMHDEKFFSTFPMRYDVYSSFGAASKESDIVSILGAPEQKESGNGKDVETWRFPMGSFHKQGDYLPADQFYFQATFDAKTKKLLYKRIGGSGMSISNDFYFADSSSQTYSAYIMSNTGTAGKMNVRDTKLAEASLQPDMAYEDVVKALGSGGLLLDEHDYGKEICWTDGKKILQVSFKADQAGGLTLSGEQISIGELYDVYAEVFNLTLSHLNVYLEKEYKLST